MTARQIADRIPAEYRKEILDLNMINQANAIAGDTHMYYLMTVWKNYIEPSFEPDCNLCLARVLKNFKLLKQHFINLEQENQLLNEVNTK